MDQHWMQRKTIIILIKCVPVYMPAVKYNYLFKLLFFLHYCHWYQLLPQDHFEILQHIPRIFTPPLSKGYARTFYSTLPQHLPQETREQTKFPFLNSNFCLSSFFKFFYLHSLCMSTAYKMNLTFQTYSKLLFKL